MAVDALLHGCLLCAILDCNDSSRDFILTCCSIMVLGSFPVLGQYACLSVQCSVSSVTCLGSSLLIADVLKNPLDIKISFCKLPHLHAILNFPFTPSLASRCHVSR